MFTSLVSIVLFALRCRLADERSLYEMYPLYSPVFTPRMRGLNEPVRGLR